MLCKITKINPTERNKEMDRLKKDSKIHTIDLDANPMTPEGWTVDKHTKGGKFEWDHTKLALYRSQKQKTSGISGHELLKKLEEQTVLNANALDYLIANQELIPKSWEGWTIPFWGTIYVQSDGYLCVRFIKLYGDNWNWQRYRLDNDFDVSEPAVILRAGNQSEEDTFKPPESESLARMTHRQEATDLLWE
jgi:hypothetical protein